MSNLLFPNTGRINGAWIIPNPNAPGATLAKHFQDLWRLWDWDGWVKPQLDAALALGCNTIGAIGDVYGVADGTIPRADYKAYQIQIAEYLKTKGAYYLPCVGNVCSYVNYSLPASEYAAVALDYLPTLEAIGNSIGVYVIDEPEFGSFADGYIAECSRLIKAGGCNLPRTVGISNNTAPLRAWVAANISEIDWISCHCFAYPCAMTYLDDFLLAYPDKDVLIGSTGKNMTALSGTGGGDDATVVLDTAGVYRLAYGGHPKVRGIMQWSAGAYASTAIIADPTSKDHGLYDTNTTPGVFVARRHKTQLVQRFTRGSVALSTTI